MKAMNYVVPALACLVAPFLIPIMLIAVAVLCIGAVASASKYDV